VRGRKRETERERLAAEKKAVEGKQGVSKAKKLIKFLNMLGDQEN
jgi:hypothetical protein